MPRVQNGQESGCAVHHGSVYQLRTHGRNSSKPGSLRAAKPLDPQSCRAPLSVKWLRAHRQWASIFGFTGAETNSPLKKGWFLLQQNASLTLSAVLIFAPRSLFSPLWTNWYTPLKFLTIQNKLIIHTHLFFFSYVYVPHQYMFYIWKMLKNQSI